MEFRDAGIVLQKIHWKSLGLIWWGFVGFCSLLELNCILITPAFQNYMDLFGGFRQESMLMMIFRKQINCKHLCKWQRTDSGIIMLNII